MESPCLDKVYDYEMCCVMNHSSCWYTSSGLYDPVRPYGATWEECCEDPPMSPIQWVAPAHPLALLLYCGPLDIQRFLYNLGLFYSWDVHFWLEKDTGKCFSKYDATLRLPLARSVNSVILLSPFLWKFKYFQHTPILQKLVLLQNISKLPVIGLPVVERDSNWHWPVRKIRRRYWKLQYTRYPTGYTHGRKIHLPDTHPDTVSNCFGGDSTSGTRIYRAAKLRQLLRSIPSAPENTDASWFVALDLAQVASGGKSWTCMPVEPMYEHDYLEKATLSDGLASSWEIEAARFREDAVEPSLNCYWSAKASIIEYTFRGLVAPYCHRLALRSLYKLFVKWWDSLGSNHYAVPKDGNALAFVRNNHHFLPWDHDVDILLDTSSPSDKVNLDWWIWLALLNGTTYVEIATNYPEYWARYDLRWGKVPHDMKMKTQDQFLFLEKAGVRFSLSGDYRAKGGGLHFEVFQKVELDDKPFETAVDLIFLNSGRQYPYYAMVEGVKVKISNNHLAESLAQFSKKDAAYVKKVMLTGNHTDDIFAGKLALLDCLYKWHNACLPPCSSKEWVRSGYCELPTNFVHIDDWSPE